MVATYQCVCDNHSIRMQQPFDMYVRTIRYVSMYVTTFQYVCDNHSICM